MSRILNWQMPDPRTLLVYRSHGDDGKVVVYEWYEEPTTDAVLAALSVHA